jgi:hypothetical protein
MPATVNLGRSVTGCSDRHSPSALEPALVCAAASVTLGRRGSSLGDPCRLTGELHRFGARDDLSKDHHAYRSSFTICLNNPHLASIFRSLSESSLFICDPALTL